MQLFVVCYGAFVDIISFHILRSTQNYTSIEVSWVLLTFELHLRIHSCCVDSSKCPSGVDICKELSSKKSIQKFHASKDTFGA